MAKKLGIVSLDQLGQPPIFPSRPSRTRRKPQPIKREENSLKVPPTNRTAIYVRNLHFDQDPEQQLQDDLRRCRDYCKEQELEVVIEYSDPWNSWKDFRQMMLAATGRRPPFDNLMVSNYTSRFVPYPGYIIHCHDLLRKNDVTVRQPPRRV